MMQLTFILPLLALGANAVVLPYAYPYAVHPYFYSPAPVPAPVQVAAPVVHVAPIATASQYHAQDEFGQYQFGHASPGQSRVEVRGLGGVTSGAYSYVDPTGKVVQVHYLADANGFRVLGANNLPEGPVADLQSPVHTLVGPEPVQDTEEVVAAKTEFKRLFDEAKAAADAAPDDDGDADATPDDESSGDDAVANRKKRGITLVHSPGLVHSTYTVHSYQPIEGALTPASTNKLELQEQKHEVVSPLVSPYIASWSSPVLASPSWGYPYSYYPYLTTLAHPAVVPAVIPAVSDAAVPEADSPAAAEEKSDDAEVVTSRRKRGLISLISPVHTVPVHEVVKSTIKYQQYEPVAAHTPADTQKIDLVEKEQEINIPVVRTVAISPIVHHPYATIIQTGHIL